jgi:hypothetical protein
MRDKNTKRQRLRAESPMAYWVDPSEYLNKGLESLIDRAIYESADRICWNIQSRALKTFRGRFEGAHCPALHVELAIKPEGRSQIEMNRTKDELKAVGGGGGE